DITPYAVAREYFQEVALRHNELLSVGFRLYQLENAYTRNGEQSFNDRKENLIKGLESLYKDYNKEVDQGIFAEIVKLYGTKAPDYFYLYYIKDKDYIALDANNYYKFALTSYD